MAYNIPERYSDLTPAPQLDKKTLNKMVWMSCFLQASFNYERMQACGRSEERRVGKECRL